MLFLKKKKVRSVRGGHYSYVRREMQITRGLIGAGGTAHCPLSFAHYNKRSASWLCLSLQVERRGVGDPLESGGLHSVPVFPNLSSVEEGLK